jgi:hypothetical protein
MNAFRQPHTSRMLKWIGLFACLLIAVAWVLSVEVWPDGRPVASERVVLASGRVNLLWGPFFQLRPGPIGPPEAGTRPAICEILGFAYRDGGWRHRWGLLPMYRSWISYNKQRVEIMSLPLWILLVPVALPTAILWYRDRRPLRGHCAACGYDLTGNLSGVCPECGTRLSGPS